VCFAPGTGFTGIGRSNCLASWAAMQVISLPVSTRKRSGWKLPELSFTSRSRSACKSTSPLAHRVLPEIGTSSLLILVGEVDLNSLLFFGRHGLAKLDGLLEPDGEHFGALGGGAVENVVAEVLEVVLQGPVVEQPLLRPGEGFGRVLGPLLLD